MNKQVKRFIRMLQERGWYLYRKGGSGHIIMRYRPGGQLAFPSTPSDHRWILNAQAEARHLEEKFGPWVPPIREHAGKEIGLDYKKPEIEYRPPVLKKPEMIINLPVATPIREINVGNLDKEIIIQTLQFRFNQIRNEVEPLLVKFEEYKRLEKTLKDLGRIEIPDEEKILEKIEKKKTFTKSREIRILDLVKDIKEIILSHNGRIAVLELLEWLSNVKGYDFTTYKDTAPRSNLVQRIMAFNKEHPEQQTLFLEKPAGTKSYEYVEYRGIQTHLMEEQRSGSNA